MVAVITPTKVENDGGYRVELTDLNTIAITDASNWNFHVGPAGTAADDPIAYAGSYGTVNECTVLSGASSFVTPPLPDGPYLITAYNPDIGSVSVGSIEYHQKQHQSSEHSYRKLLPDWWITGPRSIVEEAPQV